jgi:diguanylate cyclase (GGDEF)-like protein
MMRSADDSLRVLWRKYRPSVLEQVAIIERGVAGLIAGSAAHGTREEVQREAHKLAGSVGTFGFHAASERARVIELTLANGAGLALDALPVLSAAVVSLRSEVEETPRGAPGPDGLAVGGPSPLVLIVDDDEALLDRLAAQAVRRGMRAVTASSPQAGADAVARERPDLVLLDLLFPDGVAGAYELLSDLTALSVPVLALTISDELADRVEVARRGGHGFLRKSLGSKEVVDAVVEFLERTRTTTTTILALDDDPTVLEAVRALLAPQEIELVALEDPHRFWEVLNDVSPDLVILDFDMPGLTGVDVCRVLRNDARWARVPVLFLTGRTDPESVGELFAAGADDYVAKPIVGDELTVRISNRLDRTRLYRAAGETDPLTGIANRRGGHDAVAQLLQIADRYDQPLSVALLDVDRFKAVNDDFGHATGDAVLVRLGQLLRTSFRGEDVVARWGGEEFLVAMYGMSRRDAVRRIGEMLERFREEEFRGDHPTFRVTFSAGVSEYGPDGRTIPLMVQAADEALYAAKLGGRAAVVPAGGAGVEQAERIDVVVVDDDDVLGDLLVQSLEGEGHQSVRIADGERAAAKLGGPAPELPARVILLDVDLPGLDGLSILGRLASEGTLRRAKVIMLTGRSAEAEVVRALELGAHDHVAKPFSMPVLLHKVRAALERT